MEEVKPRSVPQIKGLRVEDFVDFIENETEDGVNYLSENYRQITMKWKVDCKSL